MFCVRTKYSEVTWNYWVTPALRAPCVRLAYFSLGCALTSWFRSGSFTGGIVCCSDTLFAGWVGVSLESELLWQLHLWILNSAISVCEVINGKSLVMFSGDVMRWNSSPKFWVQMGCEIQQVRETKPAYFMVVFMAACGNPEQDCLWSSFPSFPSFSFSNMLFPPTSLWSSEETK